MGLDVCVCAGGGGGGGTAARQAGIHMQAILAMLAMLGQLWHCVGALPCAAFGLARLHPPRPLRLQACMTWGVGGRGFATLSTGSAACCELLCCALLQRGCGCGPTAARLFVWPVKVG
jgi:hypothetical protein